MTVDRLAICGCLLAALVNICSAGSGQAHGTRGHLVHESTTAAPAPDHVPHAPGSLGGAYELTDHNGRHVTQATFHGRWALIFFGFAGCREACPVALDRITQLLEDMGPAAEQIQPLFVDLDFAGPDLRGLAQFVGHFHPRLIGLTGNRRQMYALLNKFQVRREIKHGAFGKKETGPRIDHSTHIFLIDPTGITRTYFSHSLSPADMTTHIRRHMQQ